MHSYTFNSRHSLWAWLLTLGGALALVLVVLWQYHVYWRTQGYRPQVQDTQQNWALERLQASLAGRRALVFAGASRTLYGIDLPTVRQQLPGWRPLMLAVNGHYSFALLKDLARDPLFRGVLILDIDARGLARNNHAALQPYLDTYHQGFSPSRALHQYLVRHLQHRLLFMDHRFGWVEAGARWFASAAAPEHGNTRIDLQRNARLDLSQVDGPSMAAWFRDAVADDLHANPPAPPARWLTDLAEVPGWVEAIRKRGGDVIFYVPPVRGMQAELAERYYPRADYWDAFINNYRLQGVDAADLPAMQQFVLPDESHIDYRDKPAYTGALMQALQQQGLLSPVN